MKIENTNFTQNIIDEIVKNENVINPSKISVSQETQDGNGYSSQYLVISIKNDCGKRIKLFVKYLPEDLKCDWREAYVEGFKAEYNFYTEIYPIFDQFQNSKNIKKPFDNVPKYFDVKIKNGQIPPIIMENLNCLGYRLRDRKTPIDGAHLRLSIKAIARYHALNYAMKDQNPKKYQKLIGGFYDFFGKHYKELGMVEIIEKCIEQVIDSFNPDIDKEKIEFLLKLFGKLRDYFPKIIRDYDDHFVMVQGDCWTNNILFLYDDKTGIPIDLKLIDWQGQKYSSPLLDFSYFFYPLATKKELNEAEHYLKLYYDTLSQRIAELGSDPEKVYPIKTFRDHWKKFSLYGLYMAFIVIKAQLFDEDEIPNMLNNDNDGFAAILKNQDVYNQRLTHLIEYFINQQLLN